MDPFVVLVERSGDLLWEDGIEHHWKDVTSMGIALIGRYVETERRGLEIRYSAEYPGESLIVPPNLCDDELIRFFMCWASAVDTELVASGLI